MKLYYGGFGNYMEYVVADSKEQAILKVGIKINAPFLPITITEIAEVDGYSIQPIDPNGAVITTFDEKPIEAEEVEILTDEIEIKTEANPRHCKKCDFACYSQGDLLRHYRDAHPKGD